MKRVNLFVWVGLLVLLALPSLGWAAETTADGTVVVASPYNKIGMGLAVIGAGLAVMGAGRGIGQIGGSALESIARQPEAGQRIAANMIIAAALVEGVALFAVVVALLALFL